MFVFRTLRSGEKFFANVIKILRRHRARFCAATMVEYFAPPPHNHLHLARSTYFAFTNNICYLKTINLYKM